MKKNKNISIFGLFALIIFGSGFIFSLVRQSAIQEYERPPIVETINVRLKWLHQAQFAGIYVAEEKGFYRENSINVNIERGGIDFPPIQGVLSGDIDIAIAGADDLLVAISKGKPVKAIAVIYKKSPVVYFSLRGSGIKTPFDFIGKNIGIKKDTGTWYTYLAITEDLAIDRSLIKEISVGFNLDPLYSDEVQVWPGFRINEPRLAQSDGYEVNLIKPEDYGIDIYADVLFATTDTIRERPEVVKAFVQATMNGWQYAIDNIEETTKIVMKYATESTQEHERYMLVESVPLIKPSSSAKIGEMHDEDWRRTYELLNRHGLLEKDFDLKEAYTNQFLDGEGP